VLGMDKITEEISHFIGIFHTNLEAARQRESYDDFTFSQRQQDLHTSPSESESFEAPFELLGYDPSLAYRPVAPVFPGPPLWTAPSSLTATQSTGSSREMNSPTDVVVQRVSTSHSTAEVEMPEIDPVGSVVNYFQQHIILTDNDVFSVGNHGLEASFTITSTEELLDAAEEIVSLSPLADIEAPGSAEEMISLVKAVAEALDLVVQNDGSIVAQGEILQGSYVNGELVTEVPRLEDYHTFEDKEGEDGDTGDDDAGPSFASSGPLAEASVTITMGDNVVINDAVLKSLWTGASVTAVIGDHIEVNAVIQVNAIWDEDDLGSAISGWDDGASNQLFNIANFEREDGSAGESAEAGPGDFPGFWTVTTISGDLLIVNWIEQYTFISDQDVGIVSASGGHAEIITGDNTGINHVSIYELGFSYDLIIIGGSLYDAAIIQQFNILFDSDAIDGVGEFETTGEGAVSSSDNLLWNQATILNVGAADRFGELSQDYVDAAMSIANGDDPSLSAEILNDPAFAGLTGLRVLYISGDMVNIQMVRQTNIVGDDDQIALAMDAILPKTGASYVVETGGNTLVNNAAILDLDSLGTTYVGGEQYSQETLIQIEVISSRPDLGAQDPTLLASEAVLFLDDSMLAPDSEPAPGVVIVADYTQSQDDGLQTLLAH